MPLFSSSLSIDQKHGAAVKASFICLFLVFGIMSPYLSILIRSLGYKPFMVGVLLGVFEGAGIAGPLVSGYLADRSGNYKTGILLSYIVPALAIIPLVIFVHPLASIALLALIAFSFKPNLSLLDAVTTLHIGPGGNYGKIRAVGSISFILMVLFLQWTPALKPDNAKNIAAWLVITSALGIIPALFLPRCGNAAPLRTAGVRGRRKLPRRILSASFITGFVMIFLSRLAISPVYSFFPLYLTETLRWNAVGLMFALAAVSEVPCMFISGALIRRFGPMPLLALSLLALAVRLGIYALFPFKGAIVAAQLLHSLCFGIFHPAAVAFIAGSVPPEKRALGMSLYFSLGTGLPALLGNIAGGAIVEQAGYGPLFASFAGISVIALAVYGIYLRANGNLR